MDNWNFTGRPDIPAWPQDEQGQKEKAVLLMQTFDLQSFHSTFPAAVF